MIDAAGPFELNITVRRSSQPVRPDRRGAGGRPFDWRGLVHAQALRLLLTLPADAADARAKVLDSLKDVLKAKGSGAAGRKPNRPPPSSPRARLLARHRPHIPALTRATSS